MVVGIFLKIKKPTPNNIVWQYNHTNIRTSIVSPDLNGVDDVAHVGSLQQFCVGNHSWSKYLEDYTQVPGLKVF